jgi:hypothetical protein
MVFIFLFFTGCAFTICFGSSFFCPQYCNLEKPRGHYMCLYYFFLCSAFYDLMGVITLYTIIFIHSKVHIHNPWPLSQSPTHICSSLLNISISIFSAISTQKQATVFLLSLQNLFHPQPSHLINYNTFILHSQIHDLGIIFSLPGTARNSIDFNIEMHQEFDQCDSHDFSDFW